MKKYIYQLRKNGRYAVVIESNLDDAKQCAHLRDPKGGWLDAVNTLFIANINAHRTSRVLALET